MFQRNVFTRAISLSLASMTLAISAPAWADELRWTHFGVRPQGMGNAFVAVADDFNALFYNPAGLAWLEDWTGEFLNPQFTVSQNTISFTNDLSGLTAGASNNTDEMLKVISKQIGKTHLVQLGLTPHLVFPGFGIGLGLNVRMQMVVRRDVSIDVDSGLEAVVPIQYAKSFFENRLAIGGGPKVAAKFGVDHTFGIDAIESFTSGGDNSLKDYAESGRGVGFDAGLLFRPIEPMAPTLGISVIDLGSTSYENVKVGTKETGTPGPRIAAVNTGISFKPWESKPSASFLRVSADAHAINQPEHYSKKFNLGLEYGFGRIIRLQTGLHQGELSAGMQFDVRFFKLRFAYWVEQLGTIAGEDENLRDPRFALQLKLLI